MALSHSMEDSPHLNFKVTSMMKLLQPPAHHCSHLGADLVCGRLLLLEHILDMMAHCDLGSLGLQRVRPVECSGRAAGIRAVR